MLRSQVLFLALVLTVLPFAAVQAAPPPPCTCELCIQDPGVKCNQQENGSCVHLLRSGVCLGQLTEATTAQALTAVELAPMCEEGNSTPALEEPELDKLVPRAHGHR